MKLLYKSRPENKGGFALACFVILIMIMIAIIVYEERLYLVDMENVLDCITMLFICMVIVAFLFYLLDEAYWQIFGVEVCEYDSMGIRITKKRIIKKVKYIQWTDVSYISELKINPIWKVITHFTISGVSQDKIVIHYGHSKVFRCGTNLNKIQLQELLNITNKLIGEKRINNSLLRTDASDKKDAID